MKVMLAASHSLSHSRAGSPLLVDPAASALAEALHCWRRSPDYLPGFGRDFYRYQDYSGVLESWDQAVSQQVAVVDRLEFHRRLGHGSMKACSPSTLMLRRCRPGWYDLPFRWEQAEIPH